VKIADCSGQSVGDLTAALLVKVLGDLEELNAEGLSHVDVDVDGLPRLCRREEEVGWDIAHLRARERETAREGGRRSWRERQVEWEL